MRKLLTALIAVGMMMSGFMAVSAQDAPAAPSAATGFDSPATWTDERGDQVATVSVQNIDTEFSDYSEYSAPDRGYIFVAVNFSVTNISGSSMIVEPYDFSLLDELGRNNGRAYVSQDEGAATALFEDDLALAADESAELTLVFQVPGDVAPAVFMWQPDSGVIVLVDISEGAGENSAIASGLNAPVTWTDDRGNAVATVEITGINADWQDYGEYDEPERGTHYVAIDFTVTNISGSNMILEPYDFTMLDTVGLNNSRSWAEAVEGAEPVFSEDTPVAADETYEGTLVFQLLNDQSPSVFMWQPDSGLIHLINLSDAGEGTPTDATPEADASPAADATDTESEDAAVTEADDAEGTDASASESDDADGEGEASASASTSAADGTVVEVNGEPVVFNDVVDEENGEIRVVSTQDGWNGFDENANPPTDGTRFFLVTVEITPTNDQEMPISPLDFTVNSESGGSYASDLYLNAEDAEVQVTESGGMIPAGEPTTLVLPFMVPSDEVPVSISWNTGQDQVELELVP